MSELLDDEDHDHDRGLAFDLTTLLDRRRAMKLFAGAALVSLAACGQDDKTAAGATSSTSTSGATSTSAAGTPSTGASSPSSSAPAGEAACQTIPEETAGPFPGDGSNGPDMLSKSGIVRRDITSSFGSSTTKAGGVPLTVTLVIVDQATGCQPMAGAAVYLWHCDREGRYSLYSPGATGENYLRGVQAADAGGRLTFTTIFPAAYPGRWPHIHFEVYPNLAKATAHANQLATSQLALPEVSCRAVYATAGYGSSLQNLDQTPLNRDMVFADGSSQQLPAMAGSVGSGYTAELSVPV